MLKKLTIRNYALIDQVELGLEAGLTIITGETGAGKSILMGALAMVMGERTSPDILKDKSQNCVVEAVFEIGRYRLEDFFEQELEEVDYDTETIVRRVVKANGKSRAFVNDMPVTLSQLKKLSYRLIDIHSQHQNLLLNDPLFQLRVVDSFAQLFDLVAVYKQKYRAYQKARRHYEQLKENARQAQEDQELIAHRYNELEAARLQSGEQQELEQEQQKLEHVEEIKTKLNVIYQALSNENSGILSPLNEALQAAQQLNKYLDNAKAIAERIDQAYIDLKDLSQEVELMTTDIDYDPERADYINQRLDLIYSLEQKHRVGSSDELLTIQDGLHQKLEALGSYEFDLEQSRKQLAEKESQLKQTALELSKKRQAAIPAIEQHIVEQLQSLGMKHAVFNITCETLDDYSTLGKDHLQFLFSANKQMPAQDISKVASGGEMARVMLSIKALIARSAALPSIIFDEIDTGVSGDIADRMGQIMREMAQYMQVMSITHLPQVASKGDAHYLVYKEETGEASVSRIKLLNQEARIRELAKMLSGKELTDAALVHAQNLLNNKDQ